jgi:hypothetical protein
MCLLTHPHRISSAALKLKDQISGDKVRSAYETNYDAMLLEYESWLLPAAFRHQLRYTCVQKANVKASWYRWFLSDHELLACAAHRAWRGVVPIREGDGFG